MAKITADKLTKILVRLLAVLVAATIVVTALWAWDYYKPSTPTVAANPATATPQPTIDLGPTVQAMVAEQLTAAAPQATPVAPQATEAPAETPAPVEEQEQEQSEVADEPTATVATAEPTNWTMVQVSLYAEGHDIGGVLWELPLGTHMAVNTAGGRYDAVQSAPVGVVNGVDHGWCKPDQLDCPPHAILIRVEVPEAQAACFSAEMDISWRIQFENGCGTSVPVRVSVRYNDQTCTTQELGADYLALAGLQEQVLNATSEVGLFVSVRKDGMGELNYLNKVVPFGYSCSDCLADTQGVPGQPVPLVAENFSTFGPDTSLAGSSMLPGIVFPLPRPTDKPYELNFELKVVTDSVIWVGRYDVHPLSVTPTPTATAKP